MSVEVGSVAPDFELKNTAGEPVKLSDFRGKKVVLMFFPFAFTGTCTRELCAIRDNENEFIDAETVVLSVSCDSHFTLKNFQDSEKFTHTLLSDFWPHGKVSREYGVFIEERGMPMRGTFIIDREGVVQWKVVNTPADARSTVEYKEALAAIG
jgi:peroxiredoxin